MAGLRKLPARLSRDQVAECQETFLCYVETLGPSELRTLAARLVEVVDPDLADADDAKRLAAEEPAHRGRFLRLSSDFHGSMRITGQLPAADAALLSAQLEALMPPQTTYTEAGEVAGPDVRRADALVLLTQIAASSGRLPARGGDRPRVHLALDYQTLASGLGRVTVLGVDGVDGLSAAEARRLACDADLVPIVLGTGSRPLDVGRTYRAFTPGIRAALVQRDQGCVFPRLHGTAGGLRGAPHSSLADGRPITPSQRRVAVSASSSAGRAGPAPIRAVAVAGPSRRRHRPAVVHPAASHRPVPSAPATSETPPPAGCRPAARHHPARRGFLTLTRRMWSPRTRGWPNGGGTSTRTSSTAPPGPRPASHHRAAPAQRPHPVIG